MNQVREDEFAKIRGEVAASETKNRNLMLQISNLEQ